MPATTHPTSETASFDAEALRADFPALEQDVYEDTPLAYLDNAASSQKPTPVIERLDTFYREENSNVHRGVHRLSQDATESYEAARESVARFLNAPDPDQIVFTRGTTEGLNLVSSTFGRMAAEEGDEILLTEMEHHSNIVPWQMLAEQVGASIEVLPVTDRGELRMDLLPEMLTDDTALVAISHVSNTLGTINPMADVIDAAHADGGARRRGRGAVGPAHAGRRAGARRRLLRVLGTQGVRPHGHRRSVREAGAPRSDAALPGRRGHDRSGFV